MVFACKKGKTILEDAYCEIPFKITKLHYTPGSSVAKLILMNPTAGIFGGDLLDLKIFVRSGAKIWIRTQGSPQLHPSQGKVAEQKVKLEVEDGGELHFHSDPMIPFAGSALEQQWEIDVGKKSCFSFWDALMSGRVHHGERWQFEQISTELKVRVDQKLEYLERYSLRPQHELLESSMRMRDCNYLGTGLVHHPLLEESGLEKMLSLFSDHTARRVGMDMPSEHFLAVKVIDKEGASFQNLKSAWCEFIIRKFGEKSPFETSHE